MKQQENRKLHKKNRLQSGYVQDNLVRKIVVKPDQTQEDEREKEREQRRKRWEKAAHKKAVAKEVERRYAKENGMTLREMAVVGSILMVVLASCLWMVFEEAQTTLMVRRMNSLKNEYTALLAENQVFEANLNNSIQANDIYTYAVDVLGMHYIRKDQIITYEHQEQSVLHQGEWIPQD